MGNAWTADTHTDASREADTLTDTERPEPGDTARELNHTLDRLGEAEEERDAYANKARELADRLSNLGPDPAHKINHLQEKVALLITAVERNAVKELHVTHRIDITPAVHFLIGGAVVLVLAVVSI